MVVTQDMLKRSILPEAQIQDVLLEKCNRILKEHAEKLSQRSSLALYLSRTVIEKNLWYGSIMEAGERDDDESATRMEWLKQLITCQDREQAAYILDELQQEANSAYSDASRELQNTARIALNEFETRTMQAAYILAVSELLKVLGHRE